MSALIMLLNCISQKGTFIFLRDVLSWVCDFVVVVVVFLSLFVALSPMFCNFDEV